MVMRPDIIVIGAGPAGLMAAGQAAAAGAHVMVLEKMEKPARKLRITGKGRCNITNTKPWEDFESHVFPLPRSFKPAFMNFPNTALIRFMDTIGVPVVEERGDRVFPASSRAQDVAEALVRWAYKQGATIHCRAGVVDWLCKGDKLTAVRVVQNGQPKIMAAKAFIVATGGLSYPATGSTGDGFRWAEQTGHILSSLRPSLVALKLNHQPETWNDLSLRNVSLTLTADNGILDEEFGEMTFSTDGVEGPIVLRMSHLAVDALREGKKVSFILNCKPALSRQQIVSRLQREMVECSGQSVVTLLRKWLPAQLIVPFLAKAGISVSKKENQLTGKDTDKIAATLQAWDMPITGYGGYERAIVTAGGVSMKDVDTKTMRSRKLTNVFFAGEMLDLDADTGGYNLQIAFSTGYLAGLSAAKLLNG